MPSGTLVEQIRAVWGEHDDFRDGGFPYVAFVIEQDLAEMREEDFDQDECAEELADIAINALRALDELTVDAPEEQISDRLADRMDGETPAIIAEYQQRYADEHGGEPT